MIAGGDHAHANDPNCLAANEGKFDGTAYSNTSSGLSIAYKRFVDFAEGDAITIILAPQVSNPLALSYYRFYALGTSPIFEYGLNFGQQQEIKLFPTGNGVTGGQVNITNGGYDLNQVVQVQWVCVSSQPAPAGISSVTPDTGPAAGGTTVGISGTGFTGATAVQFGGVNATAFTVNSGTSITATSPAGSGTVDVTVIGSGSVGMSEVKTPDQFTYSGSPTPAPSVTAVISNAGPPYGGTEVTITGTNFLNGITGVKFGSIIVPKDFFVTSATSITAIAPAGTGTVDVAVTNAGGTSAASAADQFTYTVANTHDFNGDGKSDILWNDTSGDVALWTMNGGQVAQTGGLGNVGSAWSVVAQRDFAAGDADILWRDTSGDLAMWFMHGLTISSTASLGNVSTNWTVFGASGYSGSDIGEIFWRDTAGDLAVWIMNGAQLVSTASLGNVPTSWTVAGADGGGDIFWRDTAGDLAVWQVRGPQLVQSAGLGTVPGNWVIAGLGDFNGDGATDILWRDTNTGTVAIWFLTSTFAVQSIASLGVVPSTWTVAQTGDYNGDGKSDILWTDTAGDVAMWIMNGATVSSSIGVSNVGPSWQVQNTNAD